MTALFRRRLYLLDLLQFEMQRADRQARLHRKHAPGAVVSDPDLGFAVLAEEALRLDDRLHHHGIELTSIRFQMLLPQHLDLHRIAIRAEIAIELVRLP